MRRRRWPQRQNKPGAAPSLSSHSEALPEADPPGAKRHIHLWEGL